MAAVEEEEEDKPERSAIDQLDLVRSYGAFVGRAIRRHKLVAALTFAVVFGAGLGVLSLWPRTYHCESQILISQSGALIGSDERGAFRGITDLMRRRENALQVVREIDLPRRAIAERTKLQRLKAWALRRGDPRPEDLEAPLVWQVQSSLWVRQAGETLIFGVDWGHPETAALLVGAAQKIYLEQRRVAEISTIREKMQIMDDHAVKVRKEIDEIAEQIKGIREQSREQKVSKATKAVQPVASAPAAPASGAPVASGAPAPPRPAPQIRIVQTQTPIPDAELAVRKEQIASLKEDLELKKKALKEIKDQRSQKLVVAQAQMNELLTKFTPAHPEVKRLERTIEQLSEDTPRTAPLEADVATLTAKIKELEQAPTTTTGPTVTRSVVARAPKSASGQAKAEALPADILRLLDSESTETDPAVTVQLQGAISKYAGMRDGIRAAQLDLDTAQAAFNHRYKILEPPEPPGAPIKPNARNAALGAFGGGLVLALLLAMALELRKGKIVERWQVYQMKLPILAELELPPGSRD